MLLTFRSRFVGLSAIHASAFDGEKLAAMFERVKFGLKQKTVYEVDHAFFAGFLPSKV